MAHQSHNIPWDLLASNFKYVVSEPRYKGITNLYPRLKPTQGKELNHFVEAFARAVEDHSTCERRKYPEKYEVPEPDEVVLSDAVLGRIAPTIHRFRRGEDKEWFRSGRRTYKAQKCRHEGPSSCDCPISLEETRMATFLHPWAYNHCYKFLEVNAASYFGVQVLKTLLLYGEMDAVLRICSHPDVDYLEWWSKSECYDVPANLGWERICKAALMSYMCLNMLYSYPELWDSASGRSHDQDYRRTSSYQKMLRTCTETVGNEMSNISTYPHQQFYGISPDQFVEDAMPRDKQGWGGKQGGFHGGYPFGIFSIDDFLELENDTCFLPTNSDVSEVRLILQRRGIPSEIAHIVMEMADYTPKRRLTVADDPLHQTNRPELMKYLTYCWQLMIRCDMMAKALGDQIPWTRLVSYCIIELWGVDKKYSYFPHNSKMWDWERDDDDDSTIDDPGNQRSVLLKSESYIYTFL